MNSEVGLFAGQSGMQEKRRALAEVEGLQVSHCEAQFKPWLNVVKCQL